MVVDEQQEWVRRTREIGAARCGEEGREMGKVDLPSAS